MMFSNVSNPTGRIGLDFKSSQFNQDESKCGDLKSSPVRIGGFEMTSHTNKPLLKVRRINFDPVQGLNSGSVYFTRYPVLSSEQNNSAG